MSCPKYGVSFLSDLDVSHSKTLKADGKSYSEFSATHCIQIVLLKIALFSKFRSHNTFYSRTKTLKNAVDQVLDAFWAALFWEQTVNSIRLKFANWRTLKETHLEEEVRSGRSHPCTRKCKSQQCLYKQHSPDMGCKCTRRCQHKFLLLKKFCLQFKAFIHIFL